MFEYAVSSIWGVFRSQYGSTLRLVALSKHSRADSGWDYPRRCPEALFFFVFGKSVNITIESVSRQLVVPLFASLLILSFELLPNDKVLNLKMFRRNLVKIGPAPQEEAPDRYDFPRTVTFQEVYDGVRKDTLPALKSMWQYPEHRVPSEPSIPSERRKKGVLW